MDLITLEEYKTYQGLKKPDDDVKITMLISMVSALIQTYIGKDYESGKTVTETLSVDYDTNSLYLSNYPVDNIISITETLPRYTNDSTVHLPLLLNVDYSLDTTNGVLIRNYIPGGLAYWPTRPGSVTVTYSTGSAGTIGGVSPVPVDLKLACIELVNYYKDDEFRQSKTIQGTSLVNTMAQGSDFPKHIQVILDRYSSGI